MMKFCKKCGKAKAVSEFDKNSSKVDGLQTFCKDCKKQYNKGYYLATRDRHNPSRAARKRQVKSDNQQNLREFLADKHCADCPISDWRLLEFDHLSDKFKNVADLMSYAWSTVLKEIAKCEIVCANCHRLRTYERAGSYRMGC